MKVKEARRPVGAGAIDFGRSCKAEDGPGRGWVGGRGCSRRVTLVIPNINLQRGSPREGGRGRDVNRGSPVLAANGERRSASTTCKSGRP